MNLRLNQIRIENFKGLHRFTLKANGCNVKVFAANGVGKTSIYDAFLWGLFGKDSTGRKDFEVWPLDDENKPLRGLEVKVEIELDADGQVHVFQKDLHEKLLKGELKGYETFCWIDDVPKKVGEYEQIINALVDEDTFKALTDLTYFCAKIKWPARRHLLREITGKVGTPKGFAGLLSQLNGRSIEEYGKVLTEQKGRYEKDQKDIGPRIDELRRGLNGYAEQDTPALQITRAAIQKVLAELDEQRKHLLSNEQARQKQLVQINKFTVEQLHRASQIRSEMKQTQRLLNEKAALNTNLSEMKNVLTVLNGKGKLLVADQNNLRVRIIEQRSSLNYVREEVKRLQDPAEQDAAICFNCGQPLPAAMREKAEARKKTAYAEKIHHGNELKRQIDALEAEQVAKQEQITQTHAVSEEQDRAIDATEATSKKRIAEIDALLANPPEPEYQADEQYRKLTEQIEQAQKQIGEPVAEQLAALENRRNNAQAELDKLNTALSQADRAAKDKVRIIELGERERELAQKIADCDRELADIKRYNLEHAKLIEAVVNDKFRYVTWKMFDYFLNGDIDDRMCEAVYQGVTYNDLSTGEQIRVGVDIVNVLSRHYGVSVPLFVDHAESLTFPLETDTQMICLRAVEGAQELSVIIEERKAVKPA